MIKRCNKPPQHFSTRSKQYKSGRKCPEHHSIPNMRSSSVLLALGLLVALVSVEAIFRPNGYKKNYYGGKKDDCDDDHTTKPTTEAETDAPTDAPTTTAAPSCPAGFRAFDRVPSAANMHTSVWCIKVVVQKDPIAVEDANALCAAQSDGAVLTAFESDLERAFAAASLLLQTQSFGYSSGAIAIDGRRNTECTSRNRTVLDSLPCSDPTKVFHLTDGHTDPSYMWSHWAANEPSANMWT